VPLIAIHGFGSLRVETRALRAKELSDKLPDSPRRFAAQRIAWNSCLMRQPLPKAVALSDNWSKWRSATRTRRNSPWPSVP
jgi:hypothetical protein